MTVKKLTRKSVAIILIIVALLLAGGAATGAWYFISHRKLQPPAPRVEALFAEPDYTVVIAWEAVEGAKSYSVEYKYALFEPDTVHRIDNVADKSVAVARKRGALQFRVRAFGKYAENMSEYSEWQTYYVQPLATNSLEIFNTEYLSDRSFAIDADTFVPVTYNYKGETFTINWYEVRIFAPGETEAPSDPISLADIRSGFAFNVAEKGEYILEMRPVLYVYINGIKDYETLGLYELYEPNTAYTRITVIV